MNNLKAIAIVFFVLGLISSPISIHAAGSGGGGGTVKPTTFRYVGIITKIEPSSSGVLVTVGTSYYAVGTGIITPDTKIKLNGSSSAAVTDLQLGDVASIDVFWPSRIATKVEATGPR